MKPTSEEITLVAAGLGSHSLSTWVEDVAKEDEDVFGQLILMRAMFSDPINDEPTAVEPEVLQSADPGKAFDEPAEDESANAGESVDESTDIDGWGVALQDAIESNDASDMNSVVTGFMEVSGETLKVFLRTSFPTISNQHGLIEKAIVAVMKKIMDLDFTKTTLEKSVLHEVNLAAKADCIDDVEDGAENAIYFENGEISC